MVSEFGIDGSLITHDILTTNGYTRNLLPDGGGKQLHSDAAQTAHDPSRPKAEVAGLKFRGQSSAVRRTAEFQSRPCYRGAAVS